MREVFIKGTRYVVLKWVDVDRMVNELALKIETFYHPHLVVGIHRGGATVAHLLTDRLGLHRFHSIGCESYRGIAKAGEVKIYQPLTIKSLRSQDVLLVDDVSDTGRSLRQVVENEVLPKKPQTLRTATLHIKPETIYLPDYYIKKVDGWIIYPWETYETAEAVVRRIRRNFTFQDLKRIVVRELGLPVNSFEKALKRISKMP